MSVPPLKPLTDAQARAADPQRNAWVAASAGSGKTQVLAARILRLMLGGVAPGRILALTFTRAAAAEMQARVLTRLAAWARQDEAALAADLAALRVAATPDMLARARALLDAVLDTPGGLAIRTIHGFAQSLLGGFPLEAGLRPGFEVADPRAAATAVRAALEAVLADPAHRADLEAISVQRSPAGVLKALDVLGAHRSAVAAVAARGAFEPQLRTALGRQGEGSAEALLAHAIAAADWAPLSALAHAAHNAGGQRLRELARKVLAWLAGGAEERVAGLDLLLAALLTDHGKPRDHRHLGVGAFASVMPEAGAILAEAQAQALALRSLRHDLDNAACAARHLRLGLAHARAMAAAKARAGTVDFDDLLERAAALLAEPGGADWVRRKLDQRFDHILLDEAQDSNDRQWAIIEALLAEHGAGEGEAAASRSVFAVGDFKQSIFGFQGAAPAQFLAARERLAARGLAIETIDLATNFRSAATVLAVVDRVLADLGPDALGLERAAPAHVAARRDAAGEVLCLAPLAPPDPAADEAAGTASALDSAEVDDAAAGPASADERLSVVSSAERQMARSLAQLVRDWLADGGRRLANGRHLAPGDILILVRRRADLIAALGAALQEAGVPVAGPDRLRLGASLAVRDLISLMRVMLQPADDLALCEVLTSPLGGLDHDALVPLAAGRAPGERVWDRLQASWDPALAGMARWLDDLRARVDFLTPAAWLRHVLDHPERGARALTARLGPGALDALGELLGAAREHERRHPPSLRGLLGWLLRHDPAIRRDPDAPGDQVRLMTVHAAKGLQAPLVILADAAARPRDEREAWLPVRLGDDSVPFFHCGRDTLGEALSATAAARADELAREEARLLYVAMTRAEDCLVVTGALSAKDRDRDSGDFLPHPGSWWSRIDRAVAALGGEVTDAVAWPGPVRRLAGGTPAASAAAQPPPQPAAALPAWALQPASPPSPLTRPLSPSRLVPQPPVEAPDVARAHRAAQRGRLLHLLFERAGALAATDRAGALARLAARLAPDMPADERAAIVAEALAVLALPEMGPLFGPEALPEAMLAGRVGPRLVAGRVDRLLVTDAGVRLLEFKTSRRVPAGAGAIHPGHLAQIAAYWALCRQIWPDRPVEAALLFTAGPRLFRLDAALLASHAPKGD